MQQMRYSKLHSDGVESGGGTDGTLLVAGRAGDRSLIREKLVESIFPLVEPGSPDGVHVWPSNSPCPIKLLFYAWSGHYQLPLDRREYLEILYLCSGSAICHVNGRALPFEEGDLAVIGSTPHHSIECRTSTPGRLAALFFDPDLIRCDGGGDGADYLAPFLVQDSEFPYVIPGKTGVSNQVLELMLRIRSELPASSHRACLAVRTYLKMLLMLLVNQYSAYTKTLEMFHQQQGALERLRPVFHYLGENCGNAIRVGDAARMCGMSESQFMICFRQVTGASFMKYLTQYRIQRAQDLLVKTDRSIADISLDTGYCDQSYFGAVFRKLVGVTPAAYRRRYHERHILGGHRPDHAISVAMPAGISHTSLPTACFINRSYVPPVAELGLKSAIRDSGESRSSVFETSSRKSEEQMRAWQGTQCRNCIRLPTNNGGNPLETR